MKLYTAAAYISGFERFGTKYRALDSVEQAMRDSVEYFLESYHYIHRESQVEKLRKDGIKVFLDSGAFSAYAIGAEISLDAYCKYLERNQEIIHFASVLDSIGDYVGTWRNQAEIERRGLKVLPCFHYGEPMEVLQYYIDRYEHFTIGGLVPISTQQMKIWLDDVFGNYLTDDQGRPIRRVHGFGVTSLPMMLRYPWDSVDSSTWNAWARVGNVLLPRSGYTVDVSSQSGKRKIAGQHLSNIPEVMRQVILDEIASYNIDIERLANVYQSRWAFNVWAFQEFVKLRKSGPQTFFNEQTGLF